MASKVQELAEKAHITFDEFIGEMRKRSCSEPTAIKIWNGLYEVYGEYKENDILLSNLRKTADVLQVKITSLFTK